jgi:hypothetical protein
MDAVVSRREDSKNRIDGWEGGEFGMVRKWKCLQ